MVGGLKRVKVARSVEVRCQTGKDEALKQFRHSGQVGDGSVVRNVERVKIWFLQQRSNKSGLESSGEVAMVEREVSKVSNG